MQYYRTSYLLMPYLPTTAAAEKKMLPTTAKPRAHDRKFCDKASGCLSNSSPFITIIPLRWQPDISYTDRFIGPNTSHKPPQREESRFICPCCIFGEKVKTTTISNLLGHWHINKSKWTRHDMIITKWWFGILHTVAKAFGEGDKTECWLRSSSKMPWTPSPTARMKRR